MNMIHGIMVDLDGVLVSTGELHYRASCEKARWPTEDWTIFGSC